MTLVSTSVMTCLHPITSWLMNSGSFCGAMIQWETRGRGLEERKKACISRMKRWNLTLNGTILIGCFITNFLFYLQALRRDHRKPQKDPLSSTFWLVFQFIVQIQCEWLISWICKRKKGRDPSDIRHSCLFNCFNAEDAGWQFCPRVYGSEYWS